MCNTEKRGKVKPSLFVVVVAQSHTFISNAFLVDRELEVSRLTRRSRLEIIAEILEKAKDGEKKTRIMYGCNLNFSRTEKHLHYLLETGLLTVGNSYHTTEKGLHFLKAYQTLELLLNTRN